MALSLLLIGWVGMGCSEITMSPDSTPTKSIFPTAAPQNVAKLHNLRSRVCVLRHKGRESWPPTLVVTFPQWRRKPRGQPDNAPSRSRGPGLSCAPARYRNGRGYGCG